MFTSKTPKDINSYTFSQVLELVPEYPGLPSARKRLDIFKMIYDILGYSFTPDAALALLAEPPAELILSTAGGGKTTQTQLKIVAEKIFRKSKYGTGKPISGDKVLCLVYNKQNVDDMIKKHKRLVSRLKLADIEGLNIDDKITACTMHSFCDQWRCEYVVKLGLLNYNLITDEESLQLMHLAIRSVGIKNEYKHWDRINVFNVLSLYNYAKESMQNVSELTNNDKFTDLGLSESFLSAVFDTYEKRKKSRRVYDFTDMLTSVYNLLKTNDQILRRVQRFYEYIVADEIQDFTPIMMSILQLLVSDGTPLVCIGDEDQSIYQFRGADIYNTLDFHDKFDGGEVYFLNENRRCGSNIVQAAKKIIEENDLRFNKDICSVKNGGNIEYFPYNTKKGEYLNLVNRIKELPEEELFETVICYRERESSAWLSELLCDAGIPLNVISGYQPYQYELYQHVFDVLNALAFPIDANYSLNLYKALPVSMEKIAADLDYDIKSHKFLLDRDKCHFSSVSYTECSKVSSFNEQMHTLVKISKNMQDAYLSEYMPVLYKNILQYYWDFKKKFKNNVELDEVFEHRVFDYFNVDMTYSDFIAKHDRMLQSIKINQMNRYGLTLSTFHGLKGLEFKNVFIIDLDNDIFPNFELIDSKNYSDDVKKSLKECETRLFFVALTRAKENLVLYYPKANPSRYISLLKDEDAMAVQSVFDISKLDTFDTENDKTRIAPKEEQQDFSNAKLPEKYHDASDDAFDDILASFDNDDDLLSGAEVLSNEKIEQDVTINSKANNDVIVPFNGFDTKFVNNLLSKF